MDQPPIQPLLGLSAIGRAVDQAEILGGDPRRTDLVVDIAGVEAGE